MKLTRKRLAELQALDLSRAGNDWRKPFLAKPKRGDNCVCCGEELFVNWDIVWGESYCIHCGYPSRTYHAVKQSNGAETIITATYQYHPAELSFDKREPQPTATANEESE